MSRFTGWRDDVIVALAAEGFHPYLDDKNPNAIIISDFNNYKIDIECRDDLVLRLKLYDIPNKVTEYQNFNEYKNLLARLKEL